MVGSRSYPALDIVAAYVTALPAGSVVISGGAPGVDTAAEDAAVARGLATRIFQADWQTHGRKAGPLRNAQIVSEADRIAAFWDGRSRGTLNTVVLAAERGLPIDIFDAEGQPMSLPQALEAATRLGVYAALQRARNR